MAKMAPNIAAFVCFAAISLTSTGPFVDTLRVGFVVSSNHAAITLVSVNKSISDLRANVQFTAYLYDPARSNLLENGEKLLEKNTSILFHMSGSEKSSVFVASLLQVQTFDIWRRSCVAHGSLAKIIEKKSRATMVPSMKENSHVIRDLVKKLRWQSAGIIYQNSRDEDAERLTSILRGDQMTVSLAGVGYKNDGSIESFAFESLQKLIRERPFGIVLIIDEDKLQKLFDYLHSDVAGLKSMALTFVIFDPVITTSLSADSWYTLIALQIFIEETIKLKELKTEIGKSSGSLEAIAKHALLYDAATTAGTIIDRLASAGKWNGYNGTALKQSEQRAADALEFNRELAKYKGTGLTGRLEFDSDGFRKNMSFTIVNLKENVFTKIGNILEDGNITLETQPQPNVDYDKHLKVNSHLRVVTILDEPYAMKRTLPDGTVEYYGLLFEILNALAKETNFTYSVYEVADNKYGHVENGEWTGLVGDVLYKKADMALAALTITAARLEVVSFSTPYMEVTIILVKKKTQTAHLDLLLFMEPFSGAVWGIILTACFFVGIFLYSIDLFSPFGWTQAGERATGEPGTEFNLLNSIWFSMASILLQGPDNTPRSLSGRIAVGCFWFYVLILTSSYTANLAAFFTSSKASEQQFNLETLLKEGAQFTTIKNYALEQFLKTSSYKIYNRVYERMMIQNSLANGTSDALRRLDKHPGMYYLEEKPFVQWILNKQPCNLKTLETSLPKTFFGIPMRKDSPYKAAISHAISKLWESGFLAERRHYYMDTLSQCKHEEDGTHLHGLTADGRIEPIQMLGAYSFLVGGIILAVFILLGEVYWKRKVEKRAVILRHRLGNSIRKAVKQPSKDTRLQNAVKELMVGKADKDCSRRNEMVPQPGGQREAVSF